MSKPTIKSSTVVALNHWTKIIKEDLLYESGNAGEYLIVERGIAVGIIPLFIKNNEPYTAVVKQYRHGDNSISNSVFDSYLYIWSNSLLYNSQKRI